MPRVPLGLGLALQSVDIFPSPVQASTPKTRFFAELSKKQVQIKPQSMILLHPRIPPIGVCPP